MIEAGMQAARLEGEERREREAKAGAVHAALVQAVAGPGAQGSIAGLAGDGLRAMLGAEDESVTCKEVRDKQFEEWRLHDEDALAVARMRSARPVCKMAGLRGAASAVVPRLAADDAMQRKQGPLSKGTCGYERADAKSLTHEWSKDPKHQALGRTRKVMVEFFSDPGCPWCYVARQHLENALDEVRNSKYDIEVLVKWRPWLPEHRCMPPPAGELLGSYVKRGSLKSAALLGLPGLAEGLAFKVWRKCAYIL